MGRSTIGREGRMLGRMEWGGREEEICNCYIDTTCITNVSQVTGQEVTAFQ